MSNSELYVIELGYGGDATTIRKLLQCTYTEGGSLDVSRRDITAMRRLVCCEHCAHMSKNPLVGCGWICSYFGFPLPDRDGFCAWGEAEEDANE